MLDATCTLFPEDEALGIFPRGVKIPVKGDRFSDEWLQKVDDWAHKNAVMIRRYNAMLRYRQMSALAMDLSRSEMHRFYSCEGDLTDDPHTECPEDDIHSDDWPK